MEILEKVDLKYKVAKKIYGLSMMLDNCGISNFNKNGEQKFIHELFSDLKTKTQINLFDIGGNVGDYTQMLLEGAREIVQNFAIHVFELTQYCYDKLSNRFDDE
ncbi:MAG: hypothetical protein K8S18_10085 [Desulfobacula sp.]|nr:hypothetical protein [Desulfobacula sp.]